MLRNPPLSSPLGHHCLAWRTNPSQLRVQRRWKTADAGTPVIHPHIPSTLPRAQQLTRACHDPRCSFYPVGYRKEAIVEAVRSGDHHLGRDWPWGFLHRREVWARRLYNVPQDNVPVMVSGVKGVVWSERKRVWQVQWVEDGLHRIRAFRSAWGIVEARKRAEKFRESLEAMGRVDNRQTLRQRREHLEQKQAILKLQRKRTFTRVKEDLIEEWDRYWDSVKFHWDDNHMKQQRKKYGKVIDPAYKPPPDIDIEQLRKMR